MCGRKTLFHYFLLINASRKMQKEVACSEKGIYASAKKEATVSLKLFWENISPCEIFHS